jgi:mannose-6-phosphate isomerase
MEQETKLTIEHATTQIIHKPWGSNDLRPWSKAGQESSAAVGEIWFERPGVAAADSALLLKLLFTSAPLSIQVHPDDAFAQSAGLPNGKTEAWHILSAKPGAKVAVGLKRKLTPTQLRAAIDDGSIVQHIQWRKAEKGDTVFVPAGTIHAIGAGLVIAEIQQRSDTTYRLFDYGRDREIHVDKAVEVSSPGPLEAQPAARRLSDVRTQLVSSPYFTVERIVLPARSNWEVHAELETWLLVLEGQVKVASKSMQQGDAVFLCDDHDVINVGPEGLTAMIASVGRQDNPDLLHDLGLSGAQAATGPEVYQ